MIDEQTRLVLVNTVYFRGEWREKFSRDSTRKEDFFLDNSKSVKVQMMRLSDSIEYGKFPEMDAKVIGLPYKVFSLQYCSDVISVIISTS